MVERLRLDPSVNRTARKLCLQPGGRSRIVAPCYPWLCMRLARTIRSMVAMGSCISA